MVSFKPYLNYNGNCKEAFDLYKSVFGGEFSIITTFADMPVTGEGQITEEDKDKVMHVTLQLENGTIIMGSDCPSTMPKVANGTNISVSISADSEEEVDKIFAALSEGGKVIMPVEKTFWNSYFGMFTDRFGVNWMVSYEYPRDNTEEK